MSLASASPSSPVILLSFAICNLKPVCAIRMHLLLSSHTCSGSTRRWERDLNNHFIPLPAKKDAHPDIQKLKTQSSHIQYYIPYQTQLYPRNKPSFFSPPQL